MVDTCILLAYQQMESKCEQLIDSVDLLRAGRVWWGRTSFLLLLLTKRDTWQAAVLYRIESFLTNTIYI